MTTKNKAALLGMFVAFGANVQALPSVSDVGEVAQNYVPYVVAGVSAGLGSWHLFNWCRANGIDVDRHEALLVKAEDGHGLTNEEVKEFVALSQEITAQRVRLVKAGLFGTVFTAAGGVGYTVAGAQWLGAKALALSAAAAGAVKAKVWSSPVDAE